MIRNFNKNKKPQIKREELNIAVREYLDNGGVITPLEKTGISVSKLNEYRTPNNYWNRR